MSNYKIIVDCATNITKSVPLTPAEIAQRDQDEAEAKRMEEERQAYIEEKIAAKAAAVSKLVSLGFTEDEAKLIIG